MANVNGAMEHDDNSVAYQMVGQAGGVALVNPPANTTAGVDTPVTFAQRVHHFLIQNNTAAVCFVELDNTASTASIQVAAGTSWRDDIAVSVIHLFTVAQEPINAASGIVVRGWL